MRLSMLLKSEDAYDKEKRVWVAYKICKDESKHKKEKGSWVEPERRLIERIFHDVDDDPKEL